MKKTILALFAVLLVLSLATCDNGTTSPNESELPEKGFVTLTINVDNGASTDRALSSVLATTGAGAADYYEVIFLTGGKYYEMAWQKAGAYVTTSPSITIPTADYNGTGGNDAVLFAGTNTGKILLGVGVLGTTNITESVTSVTFNVGSLKSAIGTTGTSAFLITSPSNDGAGHSYVTGAVGSAGVKVEDGIPVYQIPPADYAGTQPITGKWTVTIPNPSYVILASTWSITTVTTITPAGTTAFSSNLGGLTYTPTTPDNLTDVGTALSGPQVFELDIGVPGGTTITAGVTGFYINAPVRAFSNSATYESTTPGGSSVSTATQTPFSWNIRGGTDITTADDGTNNGAVILLGVGTTKWGEATLTTPTPGSYSSYNFGE